MGTGEVDRHSITGDGIWKSTDGGKNWEHIGLENVPKFNSIVINPNNNLEIFASSMGDVAGGLYRTRDGGKTWKQIFTQYSSPMLRNIQMDPNNSSRLYVTKVGKNHTGLWKSEDGGDTWKELTSGLPSTKYPIFTLSPASPNRLYAGFRVRVAKGNHRYQIYSQP